MDCKPVPDSTFFDWISMVLTPVLFWAIAATFCAMCLGPSFQGGVPRQSDPELSCCMWLSNVKDDRLQGSVYKLTCDKQNAVNTADTPMSGEEAPTRETVRDFVLCIVESQPNSALPSTPCFYSPSFASVLTLPLPKGSKTSGRYWQVPQNLPRSVPDTVNIHAHL